QPGRFWGLEIDVRDLFRLVLATAVGGEGVVGGLKCPVAFLPPAAAAAADPVPRRPGSLFPSCRALAAAVSGQQFFDDFGRDRELVRDRADDQALLAERDGGREGFLAGATSLARLGREPRSRLTRLDPVELDP